MSCAPVTVFACGERERGDDAVAYAIVDALPPGLRGRIAVVRDGMLDAGSLMALPEGAPAVVVDAVAGVAPGEVVVLPLADLAGLARSSPRSTHWMSIDATVALVQTLLGEPVEGTFVGVGLRDCDFGAPLSPEVAAALPAAVAAVAAAVEALEAADRGVAR